MTQTTVTTKPLTSTPRTGSTARAGSADDAGFEATMTAVLTIGVSNDDEEKKGSSTTSASQGASNNENAEDTSGDIEIEIEITTLEGDDLLENMSVTSNRGNAEISISTDGDVGVSTDGFLFSDNPEVQIGETLTFTVPEQMGDVQGATITVSNLVNNETGAESALVIAYDEDGKEVLRCLVEGNQSGDVTVDIDVSFSKIDFKPVDNGSWTLSGNSDFTIERIDIRTVEGSGGDEAQDHHGGFFVDFRNFFERRSYGLFKQTDTHYHRSVTEIFTTQQPVDHRHQVDEKSWSDADQREKAAERAALRDR